MNLHKMLLTPLLAALVLAGCASPPLPPAPAEHALPELPQTFREGEARFTTALPAAQAERGAWWRAFGDETLNALVERASLRAAAVQEAGARLAQARALVRNAEAARRPQLGLGAGASRQAGADTAAGPGPSSLLRVGADLSWELDLFGRLGQAQQAAALDAQASAALLQGTRLLVQAETAQTYLRLRALDEERALVRETVQAYRQTLDLTERRLRAGDIAELDVVRVQGEVAANEAEALALDRQRAETEHALAVLLGEAASSFRLAPQDWRGAPPRIPAGVPATVLARRPDVAAAQQSLLAAQARVGVARTAWMPDVALTGAGGFASPDLGELFRWSARSWGIGALLSLPLFDGGRRDANLQTAAAQLDAAAARYRAEVLNALREVEDQLAALRLLAEQGEAQGRAVSAALRATALSESRWRNGLVSQIELLDARRSELRNRRQALQVRAAQHQATVGLVRALGGGWEAPQG